MGGKMARNRFGMALLATVILLAANALAQSNQVAGVFGRTFISDQSVPGTTDKLRFGDALSFEANYSHTFLNFGIANLGAEVPFVFTPTNNLKFSAFNALPKDFRAYYI